MFKNETCKVWKNNEAAEARMESDPEAEAGWRPTVWRWWIAPLAERVFKIKPGKLLIENDLKLLIVDTTEQRIERPKNQRNPY